MSRHGQAASATEDDSAVRRPRRGLAGWPIRRKLLSLVAVPLAVVVGAGSWATAQAVRELSDAQHSRGIANALVVTSNAVAGLNDELAASLAVVSGPTAQTRSTLDKDRAAVVTALAQVTSTMAAPPSGGWGDDVDSIVPLLPEGSDALAKARAGVDIGKVNVTEVGASYQVVITELRGLVTQLADSLAQSTSQQTLSSSAQALAAIALAASAAVDERNETSAALESPPLSAPRFLDLFRLQAIQVDQLAAARALAPADVRAVIDQINADNAQLSELRSSALDELNHSVPELDSASKVAPQSANAEATAFDSKEDVRVASLNGLVTTLATQIRDAASSQTRTALVRTGAAVGLSLLTLALVIGFGAAIARTITTPLRRLRSGAVDAATLRLPAAVRQIEREGPDTVVSIPPVLPAGTAAGPEAVEVAHAVDGLAAEALRLATAQVRLRQALDDAFVSMSRRSQSMVEKQLSIIDELERTEEDPDQLRNLFRLDHLAARMRRYNDNLLVLAGSQVRTRSAAPVPIADVFRAATSEMEQYERVRLQPVTGVAIAGPAAGGLVHALAELLDNAAMYSPPTSPILLSASAGADGGLRLEITDSGVGIPGTELADLNARLAMPGTIDTQVPSRMGLFVVARLAQRTGFTVRLSSRSQGPGTVAEVLVPAALVVGAATTAEGLGRLPAQSGQAAAPGRPAAAAPRPLAQPPEPARPAAAAAGAPDAVAGLPSRTPGAALSRNPLSGAGAPVAPGTPAPGNPAAPSPFQPTAEPAPAAGPSPLPSRFPRSPAPAGRPVIVPPSATGPFLAAGRPSAAAAAAAAASARAARAAGTAGQSAAAQAPATFSRPGADATVTDATSASAVSGFEDPSANTLGGPAGPSAPWVARPWVGEPVAEIPPTTAEPARQSGHPSAEPTVDFAGRGAGATSISGTPVREFFGSGPASPTPVPISPAAAAPAPPSPAPLSPSLTSPPPLSPASRPPVSPPFVAAPAAFASAAPAGPAAFGPPGIAPPPGTPASVGQRGQAGESGPSAANPPREDVGVVARKGDLPRREPKPIPNPTVAGTRTSSGAAPAAWDDALPMEVAARAAAAAAGTRYRPTRSDSPMIGSPAPTSMVGASTPIFDSISVWFNDDDAPTPVGTQAGPESVIDLRAGQSVGASPRAAQQVAPAVTAGRWAALGDQRWLATSARAAAEPEVAGSTQTGLPMRRPGANLLPSAVGTSAPAAATGQVGAVGDSEPAAATSAGQGWPMGSAVPGRHITTPAVDPEAVRGRLGSYQRGLTSARRARRLPTDPQTSGLFVAPQSAGADAGQPPGHQGGDS